MEKSSIAKVLLSLLILTNVVSYGQVLTFDETTFIQLYENYQKLEEMKKDLENQIKELSVANDLMSINMGNIALTNVDGLAGRLEELFISVGEARGLMGSTVEVENKYKEIYGEYSDLISDDPEKRVGRLEIWLDENEKSMISVSKISAQILDQVGQRKDEFRDIVSGSDEAEGEKAVAQATNQLLATLGESIDSLNTQQALRTQAEMARISEEHAKERARIELIKRGQEEREALEEELLKIMNTDSKKVPLKTF